VAFYNPVARSLRGVEDASQMPGINQHMDIEALKRSTVSDALALFDPQLLTPLIQRLRQQLPQPQPDEKLNADDRDLRRLLDKLQSFDGSYFRTHSDVGWALRERHGSNRKLRGRVRLNLHLCNASGLPTGVSVAGAGDAGEPEALLNHAEAGQIIVADRGCFSHETVHQLRQRQVDLVLRLQRSVKCDVIGERQLNDEDRVAGVISDQIVLLTGKKNPYPPTPMRLVTLEAVCDTDRAQVSQEQPQPLRLLTSLQEPMVGAWMIGHLYRRRWDIELFFRWLKCVVQWDHLISQSRNGMLMQFYVALIGTLLLALVTHRKPDRYAFNLLSMAAAGQGSVEDALAIYQRRQAQCDRDKARRQQRQREKQAQS
jgi:hypothetical protein